MPELCLSREENNRDGFRKNLFFESLYWNSRKLGLAISLLMLGEKLISAKFYSALKTITADIFDAYGQGQEEDGHIFKACMEERVGVPCKQIHHKILN